MKTSFKIESKTISPNEPCFIIAEAGVNHNGRLDLALKLVDEAKYAGADAIKFQTFNPELMVSADAKKADYQNRNDSRHKSQFEMLSSLALSESDFKRLKSYCSKKKITFLSSPFDLQSAGFLLSLDVKAFKLGSGEITNYPLLAYIAKTKKPLILSTGMCTLKEVDSALRFYNSNGGGQVSILHCTSSYPAEPSTLNLRAIKTLSDKFKIPVGFSDHSKGIIAPALAVSLGALIIEKHFTLDKMLQGPDHKASLEPDELKEMVDLIRLTETMLGGGLKKPTKSELNTAIVVRKSVFTKIDVPAGKMITEDDITTKRPADGIPANQFFDIIGKKAKTDIEAGTQLKKDMLR